VRALTLMQPYASLVIAGLKKIETRSWRTHYRGPLAIHAGGNLPAAYRKLCYTPPFARALAGLGHDSPDDLPRGVVLGTVELVGCLWMKRHRADGVIGLDGICIGADCDPRITPTERAFGVYDDARWAWILANPVPFETAIPAQGLQRVWEWHHGPERSRVP
jgi:hypothetical protein